MPAGTDIEFAIVNVMQLLYNMKRCKRTVSSIIRTHATDPIW